MFKRHEWDSKAGKQSGLEDMVLLTKIAEDAICDNLKKRFNDDLIYTYIGPILIVVNPFKYLPYYSENEMEMYQNCTPHEVPPHIWAITDHMYREMLIEGEDQCVIISGESGAGKTVAAKHIIQYIAGVAPKAPGLEKIKDIIIESNPLLESFGNAKTLRNNNSSRFGKYFQIEFSRGGIPDGGKISNFLLEKSRVTYQQKGERNFHIFYQLVLGASPAEKESLGLVNCQYFHYLNMSGTFDADGQDDEKDFKETRNAMTVCGISPSDQEAMLRLVAGILHMGNIQFMEDGTNSRVSKPEALEFPAYLLGIDAHALNLKLTSRQMITRAPGGRTSIYEVPLNVDQANFTRDALVKSIYTRMFDWIVYAVNAQLRKEGESMCLGVLDIYGFEIFDRNGFEQFCINYVNEKLQQIFIELTLRAEQDEYAREGIQWTPIDFFNNKIVCELIEEKRPVGIMAVLDDVCAQMHAQTDGADVTFINKASSLINNKHFIGLSNAFTVRHYAGNVTYDANGFCESNRDTLFQDLIVLMQSTNVPFLRNLFPEDTTVDDRKRPTTASLKIRNQANELVDTLMRCTPHYVRCIKPNETKRPRDWENDRVLHQVRYLNLKENIRIRRAGYAFRQPFDKFVRRFAILTPETFPEWRSGTAQQGCLHIMKACDVDPTQYQMGNSKIFIKSPESLFMLEELRNRKYHGYALKIQRAYRRWKAAKYFVELKQRSQDIMYGQKERKRISLRREFIGDYIGFIENPALRVLLPKRERVIFADNVTKYERRFKPQQRVLLMTDRVIYLIALEVMKDGPQKGQAVHVVRRTMPLDKIEAVSVSTLADDVVVFHIPGEYDNVFETVFKTELISLMVEKAKDHFGKTLNVRFSDAITYTVKKVGFSGAGTRVIKFQHDSTVKIPTMNKNGIMLVPPGMPKDSKNIQPAGRASAPRAAASGGAPRFGGPPPASGGFGGPPPASGGFGGPPPAAAGGFGGPPPAAAGGFGGPPPASGGFGAPPGAGGGGAPRFGGAPPASGGFGAPPGAGGGAPRFGGAPPASGSGASGKRPAPPPASKPKLPQCRALYDYAACEADELSLSVGDVVSITAKDDGGWWTGTCNGRKGLFPSNYVEMI
ncbi:myosin I [Fonticula alba]|uniref:Myosin I n=1 Tax=Fonticula alba TaxID=691883 RepID=A0A058ZG03_FONAL|nr:myosin I [Fonticula alba]KCV73289.1 myosin I [Fonticula alba]|eukprot:XP_009492990.1 myosin I [Fonticula alba]